jgi:hypothetical protein
MNQESFTILLTTDQNLRYNFMDLPLILNFVFSRRIGLFGEADGLDPLLKTSATMINFFNEKN